MASPAKILGRERKGIPLAKYANVQSFAPTPTPKLHVPDQAEVRIRKRKEERLARKCDQAARVLDKLEERSAELARTIKALQKRKSALEARYSQIEDRIVSEMQASGFSVFHGLQRKLALKDCPLAVQITDAELVPDEFLRIIPASTAPDKVAIKVALQADPELEIPGCSLTQQVRLQRS